MKTYLITGSCGFIGSNLALRILNDGSESMVIGVDRIDQRHIKILDELKSYKNFKHYNFDLSNIENFNVIEERNIDLVFHLAANADVRFSSVYPEKDLNDGIIATYNVLRWMKSREIKKIAYASTAAVYGDPNVIPTPETYPVIQTSFYGASKIAGEALIQAHCASYDTTAWIFRYCSITGPRYSHGFIYNFYAKLKADPNELYVHGGKNQRKTYLDVEDCIDAMFCIIQNAGDKVNIFNVGNNETCSLVDTIPIIVKRMGIEPRIVWSGNNVGWIGDSEISYPDLTKLLELGWKPKYAISDTVLRTLNWLNDNQWILDKRKEL